MRSGRDFHSYLMASAAAVGLLAGPAAARAAETPFNIAPQSLETALADFSSQSALPVLTTPEITGAKKTGGVVGVVEPTEALALLLQGTGLTFRREGDAFLIVSATAPQSGSAAGDGADGTVEALIVTAQKREEDIQDVPIAISAFTQEQLERSQVAGGPDLMTQVPNMTFTKTNFSSYSIQLRGIGTQAISATVDPAVAVAFNNTPFIRNRFFEQEFYDLQRVEVLRGPQGTLYGRNATAGVVNLISRKPTFGYEAKLSADVANYNSTRLEGMLNVPLVDDIVALRLAGAWTKREGFVTNQITGNQIDGRDLWSTRVSLRVSPNDRLDVNLVWEHFEEDDDRLRSGKQLCHKHEITEFRVTKLDGTELAFPVTPDSLLPTGHSNVGGWNGAQANFSQGCIPASLYAPESFQTPNGRALPYFGPLRPIGARIKGGVGSNLDPYVSRTQSRDLRVIDSTVDPKYQAETDLVELQFNFDLTDTLTLSSETGYSSDTIFSSQDFNRFATISGVFEQPDPSLFDDWRRDLLQEGPNGGIFCDPQIGCADRLVGMDLSTAKSRQFSQEFRLASSYDGPFNFSLGANYLRYDTEDKYYVFFNTLSMIAAMASGLPGTGSLNTRRDYMPPWEPGVSDNRECMKLGFIEPDPLQPQQVRGCHYIDPNPIESLNDLGHNYFLSKNPYKLISYAVFGEAYYNVTDNLKVTAGLRWTVDKKEAPRIPSWVLAADTVGYPVAEVIEQEWRKPTGRLTVDWKPDLAFTDETLLYASYAHGYKAGGSNPPATGIVCYLCAVKDDVFVQHSATQPKTFDPEYVDAFELGAKNTLLDGKLTLNTAAFYYDYQGYQISQIVNRAAINYNFDAEVWGLEIEADWRPLENLRLGFKGGYEDTRVADGMQAVDLMNRTAGNDDWIVLRPIPTNPSNCIMPRWLFVGDATEFNASVPDYLIGVGNRGEGSFGGCEHAYLEGVDPVTRLPYVANPTVYLNPGASYTRLRTDYPGWDPSTAPNNGEGFFTDLSGNELPNAPNFTATITADYTVPLPNDWLATLHTDLYYQSEAWTRIFNMEGYDKLKAYTNVNLAAIFTNEEAGWKVMAYIKNVFDRDSITGAFLNSDDTGLTTNVFLTEPRLYGLRVTKEWSGGPWWTGANPNHAGPFPLTVELGGQIQRQDAPYEEIAPQTMAGVPAEIYPAGVQNRDLDWGDGRSVRLAWQPAGSAWSASAGLRYGRTNSDTARIHAEAEGDRGCGFYGVFYGYDFRDVFCDPSSKYYNPDVYATSTNWTQATARNREEHQIIDFDIGRDMGLGGLAKSTVKAGLRYAAFESRTEFETFGITDWDVADGWMKYIEPPSSWVGRKADILAEREFKGAGPTLSWDAGVALLGGNDTGHLNLDWSVTGGVLFGKQKTAATGTDQSGAYVGSYHYFPDADDPVVTVFDLPQDRSNSVTVPMVDLSLGFSYKIQRFKVGGGYRWERYFDVLDAGYGEQKDADRTIDGPYFKLAVGFGG